MKQLCLRHLKTFLSRPARRCNLQTVWTVQKFTVKGEHLHFTQINQLEIDVIIILHEIFHLSYFQAYNSSKY